MSILNHGLGGWYLKQIQMNIRLPFTQNILIYKYIEAETRDEGLEGEGKGMVSQANTNEYPSPFYTKDLNL